MSAEKLTATEKRLKERQAKLAATGEAGSVSISGEDALEAVSDCGVVLQLGKMRMLAAARGMGDCL